MALVCMLATACSAKKNPTNDELNIDIKSTFSAVQTEYLSEMAAVDYTEEQVEMTYGLTSEHYESFVGIMPAISAVATDVAIFEAKEGQVEAVVDAVTQYKQSKIDSAWYPAEQENAENAVIFQQGNYVFFIMAHDTATLEGAFKALLNGETLEDYNKSLELNSKDNTDDSEDNQPKKD